MPTAILKAIDCVETEDITHADSCRLEIKVDDQSSIEMKRELNTGQRWFLNETYTFRNEIVVTLWDEDNWPDPDDFLGTITIGNQLTRRSSGKFDLDEAEYILWYEVIDPIKGHWLEKISLRSMLGRLGQGILSDKEYSEITNGVFVQFHELISARETFSHHAVQDGSKGNTSSLREWIESHCNPWGEGSVIPVEQIPQGISKLEVVGDPSWVPVTDEKTRLLAGFQHYSRQTKKDFPFNHETMDWNWDQFVDPAFTYMLSYTSKRRTLSGGLNVPYIHNEWETGSMPLQWRPFWGEYVTVRGRHVHDVAHAPVNPEVHPANAIIREYTAASGLGPGGSMVPATRAIIGLGVSGGFPGDVGSRWNDEFGGIPSNVSGDTTDCWATNLKTHGVRHKLFPPVAQPSDSARLKSRVVLCEYIQVSDGNALDDFLELCQNDDPAEGGSDLAFRVWDRARGLPNGFRPKVAPASIRPKFTLHKDSAGRDAYFDVEIDLSAASQIPVGYFTIIECGWSERGTHEIYEFTTTFEKVRAVETDEHWDDWHLYYGVNGQWVAWWTDDFVEEGQTYTKNAVFQCHTIDDMPLVIRDCGIEWNGFDFGNDYLDRLAIIAPGPHHFTQIRAHKGISTVSSTANTLRIQARCWEMEPGATKHEWTIKVKRREL